MRVLKFVFCFCLAMILLGSCSDSNSVHFTLKGGVPFKEAMVEISDTTLHILLDSAGCATCSIEWSETQKGYGKLSYGKFGRLPLFFYRNFECVVDLSNAFNLSAYFSGEGALWNQYIGRYDEMPKNFYSLTEKEFLQEIERRYRMKIRRLDSVDFPSEFRKIEEYRLRLSDAYYLYTYFQNVVSSENCLDSLTEAYYSYWKHFWIDDSLVLANEQAKGNLLDAVRKFAGVKIYHGHERERIEEAVNTVSDNFTVPALRSYLLQMLILAYADRCGVKELGELKGVFDKEVTDSQAKEKLAALYKQAERIEPGNFSPGFVYEDVNGKKVSLESLRGKYVYIDIWATWCSPCRREIPHLEKLEEYFAGKNICFVSISTDKDREAWKKMVKENEMEGIQLNVNGDLEFSKAYMIRTIPRFILLDPQGRIINSEMSRPSDPMTFQFLKKLEDI